MEFMVIVSNILLGYNNHKPPIFLGMVDIPAIYGDDWGMVYYCFTDVKLRPKSR